MNDKNKLIELMLNAMCRCDYSCEICNKMGYKCKVVIPEDADLNFKPDYSKCEFNSNVYKTLTTEH